MHLFSMRLTLAKCKACAGIRPLKSAVFVSVAYTNQYKKGTFCNPLPAAWAVEKKC
jgi:hypothetical protein